MTERLRGFEVAKGFENEGVNLPTRSTANSAGYDFEAARDTVIPSIWKAVFHQFSDFVKGCYDSSQISDNLTKLLKPTLVPTGVKAYMQEDEVLYLTNRSSNPLKFFLLLGNGIGVVDADYYGNPDNDGHIMFQFINFGFRDVVIKKGTRIGQGVFAKFLKVDGDRAQGVRVGGFGSTGSN